jgi:carbon storage regulator
MLILTRRVGESIVITTADGQEIEMVVLGQKGNQIRLGFEADKSIDIVRSELLDVQAA